MRVRGSLFCALILSVLSRSMGHSWIDCTSYNGQVVDNSLDSQLCEGRPRDFTAFNGGGFGRDRGFDYQPQKGQPACITGYSANSYDSDWPMATYNPGESIKLLWPAKNHDKGPCTNPYIPDTSLKLFMDCGLEGERNPTIDDFAVDSKLVIDFKANGGKGFQNCK